MREPNEDQVLELASLVQLEMGEGNQVDIVGGTVRLEGTDTTAAVARTEHDDERGLVFTWAPRSQRWRARRDLDADTVQGLIEWRRLRDERRGDGSEFDDGDEYQLA